MDELNTFFTALSEMVLAASGQPWVFLVVLIAGIIDGFFPPIPSEAIVLGLASLLLTQGVPNPFLLLFAAALGAFIGDNVAFGLGRLASSRNVKWLHGPRLHRSAQMVGRELDRRGASLILAGRFIPVGRIAVNMAAGATGYRHRKFAGIAAVSSTLWACYTVGIGALAGSWFRENQLLGMAAAIVFAVLLGFGLDWLGKRVRARGTGSPHGPAPATARVYEAAGSRGSARP